ncbi:MAG: serine hydrolase domain-containing protein [Bacteroidota bacterium]|nr:serine hydrolase domain-containing protein [Bacteroidota bacterium]MDP3145294.1 serine hydrolase domain-containing protein [Bacteroidota bacterium]
MNRLYVLTLLLVMFLSCGNSSNNHKGKTFAKPAKREPISNLNKEEKFIAFKLDTFFTQLNRTGTFNGSALIARDGKIIYKKSFGILDKTTKEVLTDSSMFQLASVSKIITATAVLMLYERELIDLNKPFQFYFPDFPYETVTIKQLLSHRSGLANYLYALNSEVCQPNCQMSNNDMYCSFVTKNPKPYLKPNKRFNYCNTNYALLALLVEKVSGKTFSQFLREEIFNPLNMNHTATIKEIDLNGQNITKPYDNKWKPVDFDASDYVLGDKSLYSTPYDLFLFSDAMYNNKIIKAETQELAYTAYSREKKLSNYGFGWRLKDVNDSLKKEVYHNGWWHGYRSSFHRRLNDKLTVIILSNQLNSAAYHTYRVYQIIDNVPGTEIVEFVE